MMSYDYKIIHDIERTEIHKVSVTGGLTTLVGTGDTEVEALRNLIKSLTTKIALLKTDHERELVKVIKDAKSTRWPVFSTAQYDELRRVIKDQHLYRLVGYSNDRIFGELTPDQIENLTNSIERVLVTTS